MRSDWVVSTNRARCRDCYRCVRTCHVKAVRVQDGQAQVVPELCIACGSCVRACPQEAKIVRDDRPLVKEAIAAGRTVVATVAPSAPAYFGIMRFEPLASALRALGFAAAGETAFGAEMVGQAHRALVDAEPQRWPLITSSCPVVGNLIERYYPDLIPHLAPIVSPMVAHGRHLRALYGRDAYIVFIGPCIAKKAEILDDPVLGAVDAALTFAELEEWVTEQGGKLKDETPLSSSSFILPPSSFPAAPLFPIEGGLVGTAKMDTSMLTGDIVTTSGLEACEDVLQAIRLGKLGARMVELMACEGGCINGPAMEGLPSAALSRQRVIEYARNRVPEAIPPRDAWPDLTRTYSDRHVLVPAFSEEQIREVLHRVDKWTVEDELNCGACGYPTCRDKAVATLRGMAEATMCIPYMRRRAESLRQVVMEATPNAILITDSRLYVQDLSPSAERMLGVRLRDVVGKPLQTIMEEVDGFSRVRNTGQAIMGETAKLREGLVVEQTIVPVEGENLLLGILRDVTEREREHDELERIRTETLSRTQEVVKNQMRVAQEIAQLLGETTAETKMMLSKLAKLLQEGKS